MENLLFSLAFRGATYASMATVFAPNVLRNKPSYIIATGLVSAAVDQLSKNFFGSGYYGGFATLALIVFFKLSVKEKELVAAKNPVKLFQSTFQTQQPAN